MKFKIVMFVVLIVAVGVAYMVTEDNKPAKASDTVEFKL